MGIGASADWDFKLCPQKDFKWPKKRVRALGVWLSTDPDLTISLNYKDKIEKIKLILGCWKLRRLGGLLGEITVLKSLIVSQLVYIFSPLETNHTAIKDIEDITRWREDMNFMFEWQEQYLTNERSERARYCSCHKSIKFISSS